ncbi:hypothetical protein NSE01_25180 [Novosphingobium sediminis]|uniref:Uncharacterized protein n=1 Tax=Novosphingobium sediminis TaxID=707214 RepID=A0A512ALX7_9SPHN|nr:O-antigen ligase domain-containing protein [Novosphingobium sediminis]GEO00686.1 hypothetical protein NSE01_25180 [Novosphingobium sediminis]
MAAPTDPAPNAAERLIAFTIGGSYWLWLVGGLYLAGPLLGWALAIMAARACYLAPVLPEAERPAPLPIQIWAWLLGMAAMLVILLVAHAEFSLGSAQTVKSAAGWAKGWALLGLFPFAGYVLPIRLSALARAVCRLSLQTMILMPLLLAAPFIHLPSILWVSPLKVLGGASDEFFAVVLYTIDPEIGTPRWQFFAPWSPAAGMVAMIHFLIAREERSAPWRWTGYTASVLMALLSQSRMALVALAIVIPLAAIAGRLAKAHTWFTLAPLTLVAGWLLPQLAALSEQASSSFNGARASSSRVRATLGRIAVERWQHEAYWFGHGIVERGPHLVEYMPIGSHHSWYGLLYVKGLLGVIALGIPMVLSLVGCVAAAAGGRHGRLALSMILTYWLYSFGENLEVLVYISWPALLALGIALRLQRSKGASGEAGEALQ